MSELPLGTVTFAFTDIEGSTVLLKRLGDAYADVLAAHRRLVRAAFTGHGGIEVDTQGDAFFFVFVRARDAVAAAAEVQLVHVTHPWPPGVEVRLRVGLHTGEPTLGEEGYLGIDVVRAARLCSVGRGGQVLLSETTRALVGSTLPPGVSLFPLGKRHLKDIDEPERVYELEIEGVEPPSAPTADAPERVSPSERKGRQKQWEADFEQRVEDYVERTTKDLMERTIGSLDHQTSRPGTEDPRPGGVDAIAAHAHELAKLIEGEIRRAQGDPPDGGGG